MDINTVKALTIQLREQGLTFNEISDLLYNTYGLKRSRQALNGLYNRAKQAEELSGIKLLANCDIVNVYCRKDNAVHALNELKQLGVKESYYNILKTINSETMYIKEVEEGIVRYIEKQLSKVRNLDELRGLLDYKGVSISDKKFYGYLEAAYKLHIKKAITMEISKAYSLTNNKALAKALSAEFDIKNKIEENK